MNRDLKGEFEKSSFLEGYRYLDGVDVLIIDFKENIRKSFNVPESLFKEFLGAENQDEFYKNKIEKLRAVTYACGASGLSDGTYMSFVQEQETKKNVYERTGFKSEDAALKDAVKESKKWFNSRS